MMSSFPAFAQLICVIIFVFSLFKYARAPYLVSESTTRVDIFFTWLTKRVGDAGFFYSPESIRSIFLMSTIVSILCGFVVSPVMALVVPLAAGAFVAIFLAHCVRQRGIESERINDEICYFIARGLRAGHSLESCLSNADHTFNKSVFLKSISQQISGGLSLVDATARVESESSSEKMLCATISLAHEMGGNSARIFDRIGDYFHQTYELSSDTTASLSQVRMSAYVIGALPGVMLVLSIMMGSDTTTFLFTQPIGWMCLLVGGVLETLGAMWMKKLVHNGVGIWTS